LSRLASPEAAADAGRFDHLRSLPDGTFTHPGVSGKRHARRLFGTGHLAIASHDTKPLV